MSGRVAKASPSFEHFLNAQRLNVLFIQPRMMVELRAIPAARQLLEQPESLGWRRLAPTDGPAPAWLLLYREPRTAESG